MTNNADLISNLYPRFTDAKPVEKEWDSEKFMEDEDQYWECVEVEVGEDSKDVHVIVNRGLVTHVVLADEPYLTYGDYIDSLDVDDDDEPVGALLTEEEFDEALTSDRYGDDGPMMNYWYPCAVRTTQEELAYALRDLPVCVVEVDGNEGLALTGGGMDLSWQIVQAYIIAGFLPPVHFADLPGMAETWTAAHQLAYEAMMESLAVEIRTNEYRRTRLADTAARMSAGRAS